MCGNVGVAEPERERPLAHEHGRGRNRRVATPLRTVLRQAERRLAFAEQLDDRPRRAATKSSSAPCYVRFELSMP